MRKWGPGLIVLALLLPAGGRADEAALKAKIEAALQRLGPHAVAGVRVLSASRGQVLYERNADLSLNPASNMKLFTSATALAKLGPDYRFTTRVLRTAAVQDGTLTGDLILQGGGDPVLETPDLEQLADAVKAAGIRKVTGRLLADDYRFDDERLGIGWNSDDEPYYYSAQISALTLNRNVLTLDIAPGKQAGDPAIVTVKPIEGYVQVTALPATGAAGSETKVSVSRARARNEVQITGKIAVDAAVAKDREVTMEEPELWAGAVFKKLLRDRRVEILGEVERARAPETAEEVATHASRPLSEIVALLNKPSDNLIAEMLLKELGYAAKKKGDAYAGSEVVEGFLKEIGIDAGGVRINDGSGLSRQDLVTARAISDLLAYAEKQPWGAIYKTSLPIAGVDGTLRSRFKGTPAEKNLTAKTGSLSHVSALGGYVTSAGGERFILSILINNYPGGTSGPDAPKRIEDAIGTALAADR